MKSVGQDLKAAKKFSGSTAYAQAFCGKDKACQTQAFTQVAGILGRIADASNQAEAKKIVRRGLEYHRKSAAGYCNALFGKTSARSACLRDLMSTDDPRLLLHDFRKDEAGPSILVNARDYNARLAKQAMGESTSELTDVVSTDYPLPYNLDAQVKSFIFTGQSDVANEAIRFYQRAVEHPDVNISNVSQRAAVGAMVAKMFENPLTFPEVAMKAMETLPGSDSRRKQYEKSDEAGKRKLISNKKVIAHLQRNAKTADIEAARKEIFSRLFVTGIEIKDSKATLDAAKLTDTFYTPEGFAGPFTDKTAALVTGLVAEAYNQARQQEAVQTKLKELSPNERKPYLESLRDSVLAASKVAIKALIDENEIADDAELAAVLSDKVVSSVEMKSDDATLVEKVSFETFVLPRILMDFAGLSRDKTQMRLAKILLEKTAAKANGTPEAAYQAGLGNAIRNLRTQDLGYVKLAAQTHAGIVDVKANGTVVFNSRLTDHILDAHSNLIQGRTADYNYIANLERLAQETIQAKGVSDSAEQKGITVAVAESLFKSAQEGNHGSFDMIKHQYARKKEDGSWEVSVAVDRGAMPPGSNVFLEVGVLPVFSPTANQESVIGGYGVVGGGYNFNLGEDLTLGFAGMFVFGHFPGGAQHLQAGDAAFAYEGESAELLRLNQANLAGTYNPWNLTLRAGIIKGRFDESIQAMSYTQVSDHGRGAGSGGGFHGGEVAHKLSLGEKGTLKSGLKIGFPSKVNLSRLNSGSKVNPEDGVQFILHSALAYGLIENYLSLELELAQAWSTREKINHASNLGIGVSGAASGLGGLTYALGVRYGQESKDGTFFVADTEVGNRVDLGVTLTLPFSVGKRSTLTLLSAVTHSIDSGSKNIGSGSIEDFEDLEGIGSGPDVIGNIEGDTLSSQFVPGLSTNPTGANWTEVDLGVQFDVETGAKSKAFLRGQLMYLGASNPYGLSDSSWTALFITGFEGSGIEDFADFWD